MSIRYIFIALEIFMLLIFLVPFPILCSGNAAGIGLSVFLIIITVKFSKFKELIGNVWDKTLGKVLLIALCFAVLAGIAYASFLSAKMYNAMVNKPDEPNVIVVLGCKVNGTKPSRMLRRRLDTAYNALQENPDVLCVVSGGQGSNEKISEAQAMKNYLVEKGVDESRIIMEDKSTSTFENIKFTFEITDKLGLSRDITIVTDGFHQYRARLIAKAEGAGEVTAYSAPTEPRYVPTYWVREWLGLTYFYVFGK